MPILPTPNLGLKRWESTDDLDYVEVNSNSDLIDSLTVPTVCTAGTRPLSNLFIGREIWQTDTEEFYRWDGSAWLLTLKKPMWRGYSAAAHSVATGVTSAPTLTEDYAVSGAFSLASISACRTLPIDGYYRIKGQVTWQSNSTGTRTAEIRKNISGSVISSGTVLSRNQMPPTSGSIVTCEVSHSGPFNASDTVTFAYLQTSGGSLDTVGTAYQTWFEIEWLRPL